MRCSRPVGQGAPREPEPARRGPRAASLPPVLALQRAAGNRAVAEMLSRGARPPGLQRLVVRVDDPADAGRRSSDFVKTAEVDRMAEYLQATHGGGVLSFATAAKIEITPGDHWFAGHGSGLDLGGLAVPDFVAKLSFDQLKEGERATLHLVSCNLGNIRESDIFAKELRRALQANPALNGRTIIVEAAPSFIVHTAGAQGSFAKRTSEVDALHDALEEDEERIDREAGEALWPLIAQLLRAPEVLKAPPTKKSLAGYLHGVNEAAAATNVSQFNVKAANYRELVVAALEPFALAEPAKLMRTAKALAKVIDQPNGKAVAMPLAETAVAGVRERSRQLWLVYEGEIAKHTGKAAPKTLTADDPARAEIKSKLKSKDPATTAEYGWIQYSTKGGKK